MKKSPDAFRTISEVAEWLETPAHVLRFWESRFSHVKPVKRAGGRRYYRPTDMELLGGIKKLLHEDGMTIRGVQKILRENGIKHVAGLSQPLDADDGNTIEPDQPAIEAVQEAPILENAPEQPHSNVVQMPARDEDQMDLFVADAEPPADDTPEAEAGADIASASTEAPKDVAPEAPMAVAVEEGDTLADAPPAPQEQAGVTDPKDTEVSDDDAADATPVPLGADLPAADVTTDDLPKQPRPLRSRLNRAARAQTIDPAARAHLASILPRLHDLETRMRDGQ